MKLRRLCPLLAIVPLLALAETYQYDASNVKTNVWQPTKNGFPLVPFHGSDNGWTSVVSRVSIPNSLRYAVSFNATANAIISPLTFLGATTQTCSYVFAIVRSPSLDCALPTLMDAPRHDVRLRKDRRTKLWNFETSTAYHININGMESESFTPSQNFQLVEVTFTSPSPVKIGELYIGGALPRPEWRRAWRGEIGELIFLTDSPTPDQRKALHDYARRKWRVPLPYAEGINARQVLAGMGITTDTIYSTFIFVR